MRQTVTISLTEETRKELDAIAKREGVSRSDLIRESLRDFLFVRNFRRLRETMMAKAKAKGVYTDQDVFDRVS
ncbi:MAG: ribbon-helix-helix protein, CopG family [Nitrospirota bacterium]|nr:ribbon-helix-helix protein, CopG family [Nitrospirota bacterium]MDE3244343.1 ribbon-helix-helix protein, CopG family [Nitrospirota bacterium]